MSRDINSAEVLKAMGADLSAFEYNQEPSNFPERSANVIKERAGYRIIIRGSWTDTEIVGESAEECIGKAFLHSKQNGYNLGDVKVCG